MAPSAAVEDVLNALPNLSLGAAGLSLLLFGHGFEGWHNSNPI
jgi:hypothetical protein